MSELILFYFKKMLVLQVRIFANMYYVWLSWSIWYLNACVILSYRRWIEFLEGMAGLERTIRESEDRKDRRLERQLEANERIAANLIGALGQVSECLRIIAARGIGGADMGQAVSALGNLGELSAELSAGLGGSIGDQQP